MDALQISILAVVSLFMLGRPQTHTRAAVGVVAVMWAVSLVVVYSGWSLGDWAISAVAAAALALAYWAPPWLKADVSASGAIGSGSPPAGEQPQRGDVGEEAQQANGAGGGGAPDQEPREAPVGDDK
jgi:hypothetical protein